ncbi:TRAP transporter substrate-binding protein [Escherichia sp. E2593]|uniref:TRAP transporter substrate-binding protein n=1 Tax=unclassified Escherichia TaxID=2608889 RepID=UPI0010288B8A|nr:MULTISPECIES: TRAP transporter substrate-binding protein [unclassified Escherichia]RZN38206.1 TRAP transporter substrate-binding protein [Escherichia sp. E10V5]TGB79171.1 ABC transporter substrate-binding protein [Escherichia sp. E4694]TGC09932.1 ABC transporter substrate-binding protein [Escherichia sp. E2593]TLI77976.1 TRAP transporter substrate-binding protein [Escherichia sp. E2593]TLI96425.1 TRAP transporter substrate-binding protein [Escherichia sp. E4385]
MNFMQSIKAIACSCLLVSSFSSTSWAAEFVAKMGHSMPNEHPQSRTVERFAELVKKGTDGRVNIQVYSGGVLGGDEKMLRATQAGTQEIYYGSLAPISGRVKELQIFDFPFVFNDMDEVDYVFQGAMGQRLFKLLEPLGLVGLAWVETGFRQVSNNKRPINKVEDMKGLKIRVMQNQVALETFKAMGINALPMDFAEVFTALETGVIDGQENPLIHMYANKMQEVQKYVTITNHVYTSSIIIVSKKFWDKLSPVDQQVIEKSAKEVQQFHRNIMSEADKDVVKKLTDAGVQVVTLPPEEVDKLRIAVKPVVAKYTPMVGETFVKEFYAEVEKARAQKNH